MRKKNSRSKEKQDVNLQINEEYENFLKSKKDQKISLSQINIFPGIKPKNDSQAKMIRKIQENQITFISGPAGTGKTFIAIKAAIDCLKNQKGDQSKILITKPIVEGGDQKLGFLPGDIKEKVDPWMKSFEANFKKIIGPQTTESLMANNTIETLVFPLIRGDNFDNSIAILDEAQNTTIGGMKLFLSRIGETSKMIIIGDTDQTDLKLRNGEKSGLDDAMTRFNKVPGVAFMEFTEDDIVRSKILIDLMKRYK